MNHARESIILKLNVVGVDFIYHLWHTSFGESQLPIKKNYLILDELKRTYQEVQQTSQNEIRAISIKIKNAIDMARPFYEARKKANELAKEIKFEQGNYDKARTNLAAAKEMVYLAEQSVTQVKVPNQFTQNELDIFSS